jgi:hypothetical protein
MPTRKQLDIIEDTALAPDGGPARRELKRALVIDADDLDGCLVNQPGYFFNAAEAFSAANAARDMAKLELKELMAQLDGDIRRQAIDNDEKLTEVALTNRITILPNVKSAQRRLLQLSKDADDLQALKEAYVQRSYALKDLTAREIAALNNLGVERGSTGQRRDVGDRVQERQEQMRRDRRGGAVTRFRKPEADAESE